MSVAFPSGYRIGRDTPVTDHLNETDDTMDDGTLLIRVLGDPYTDIGLRIKMMTRAEMQVLLAFIKTNRAEEVTATIDGIDYIGRLRGPLRRTMTGIYYNMEFDYRAREV